MSQLRSERNGIVVLLDPDHLIGRSSRAALQLADERVSSQHAAILWDKVAYGWFIKDLASRNGTTVNGLRLEPGVPRRLNDGDRVSFGCDDDPWLFCFDLPPQICLYPLPFGVPIVIRQELLALPDEKQPLATVYRQDEQWFCEHDGEVRPLEHGAIVALAGQSWRFHLPAQRPRTADAGASGRVDQAHFRFEVSRDEEHVALFVTVNGRRLDLGARSFNYMLLTLARERLRAIRAGLPAAECGWTYHETLCKMLRLRREQLNLMVFRARRHLTRFGFDDPASLIERRADSGEMRFGSADVSVDTGP